MSSDDLFVLESWADRAAAGALALEHHRSLRSSQPWLPQKTRNDIDHLLGWVASQGVLLGWGHPGQLKAFWGGARFEDFRNLGPGVFCPDFAHGFAAGVDPFRATRHLYRGLASRWLAQGLTIHAAGTYANEAAVSEALSLTGFGRIVADLARPRSDLEADLALVPQARVDVRFAGPADAQKLAEWDRGLARHIGDPPVSMPRTHGRSPEQWVAWLAEPDAVALIAERDSVPLGFIKAEDPGYDVTWAVGGPQTLAICGLWVEPTLRGGGAARALLAALVREARHRDKTLVSVDCETLNPEAWAFWSRWFVPVTWSWERRV